MKYKIFLISLFITVYTNSISASNSNITIQEQDKESILRNQAIAQMNYNINSLTKIVKNQSMDVLQYELDQLLNNLTIESIVELYEIKAYRSSLMDRLSKLMINAEEKKILRQIQEKARQNLVWNSVSSALNIPMVLTSASGGYQAAFYTLLGIARGAIDYKAQLNQSKIAEMQAMWNLKKIDLSEIAQLRNDAFDVTYDLFKRFNLKEEERLVEKDINLYNEILGIVDNDKKIRLFEDNYNTFKSYSDYYYELGMAYYENKEFSKADENFDRYIESYSQAPIFRNNDKIAYIYLAKLSIYENMPSEKAKNLLDQIVRIIPDNGISMTHCAIKYRELGYNQEAYTLLRRSMDNNNLSDKNIIAMTILSLQDEIKKYPQIWHDIVSSFYSQEGIDLDIYISFLLRKDNKNAKKEIAECIKVSGDITKDYYLWGDEKLDDEFKVKITNKCNLNIDSLYCCSEEINEDDDEYIIRIRRFHEQEFDNPVVSKEYLIDKVPSFERNPELIYSLFKSISSDSYFVPRNDIQIDKLNEYEGLQNLSESETKSIAKILDKKQSDDSYFVFESKEISSIKKSFSNTGLKWYDFFHYYGIPYVYMYRFIKNYH